MRLDNLFIHLFNFLKRFNIQQQQQKNDIRIPSLILESFLLRVEKAYKYKPYDAI